MNPDQMKRLIDECERYKKAAELAIEAAEDLCDLYGLEEDDKLVQAKELMK